MKFIYIIFIAFILYAIWYLFFKYQTKKIRKRQVAIMNKEEPSKAYKNVLKGLIAKDINSGGLVYTLNKQFKLTYLDSNITQDDNFLWNFFYDDEMEGMIISEIPVQLKDTTDKLVLKPDSTLREQCLDLISNEINNNTCGSFYGNNQFPYVQIDENNNYLKENKWKLVKVADKEEYTIRSIIGDTKDHVLVIGDRSKQNSDGSIKTDLNLPMLVPETEINKLNCKLLKFIPQQ